MVITTAGKASDELEPLRSAGIQVVEIGRRLNLILVWSSTARRRAGWPGCCARAGRVCTGI